MNKKILTIIICLVITIGVKAQNTTTTNKGGKGVGTTGIALGASMHYFVPTGNQKSNAAPLLFVNNALSFGADISLIPKKGSTRFKLAAEYITGTNYNEGIAIYAKEKDIVYTSTKFTKAKPGGFSIMASPQFMLFPKSTNKKLPLMWLDLKAGALFSNQQSLQFFNGQTTPSKEVKSNAVSFVYNPTLVVNVIKTKKLFLNLNVGYSNFGGVSAGVAITSSNCFNISCCRCPYWGCGPACPPPTPDPPKK